MPLLPGVTVKHSGKRFKEIIQGPSTERLLIFGLAQDGPLNIPRRVTDVGDAATLFGPATYTGGYLDPNTGTETKAWAGTSLPEAIAQAVAGGAQDIWVVRYSGEYASALHGAFANKLDVRSIYPGRIYNQVSLTIATTGSAVSVVIQQPTAKGGTVTLLPNLSTTATVQELIDKINTDPRNQTIRINPNAYPTILTSAAYTAIGSGTVTLTGGTNGCRAVGDDYGPDNATGVAGLAVKLLDVDEGALDVLEGMSFSFDVAVLTGIYADDQIVDNGQTKIGGSGTYTSTDEYQTTIAYDFQTWLDRMSGRFHPCRGVVGVRPPQARDQAALISYIEGNLLATSHAFWNEDLRWIKMGPFMYEGFRTIDFQGNTFDGGARLSVVAGPEVVMSQRDRGNYTDMWHVLYAANMTATPPERAPILKPLPGGVLAYGEHIPIRLADALISGVGYDYNTQFSGRGAYVILVKDPSNFSGPMVIYSDTTAAFRDDYFSQDQLVHLVNRVSTDLKEGLRGFLGLPMEIGPTSAMRTRAKTILDGYAASGALKGYEGQGYTVDILVDGIGQVLGIIQVILELNPASVARQINLSVSLRQVA